MTVSTRARYGFSILIYIARFGEGRNIQLSEIAKYEKISIKYLEKIVQILKRAGFLTVMRGARGGYRLSRDSREINLVDIYRALEAISIAEDNIGCTGSFFWRDLSYVIVDYLESKKLSDLVKYESDCNMFYI